MNILIVEDDPRVSSFLKENLSRDLYRVNVISSFPELQRFLAQTIIKPDLFILDRLIDEHDTKSVLPEIKRSFPDSLIMFVSALNSPSEKAALLETGADDYLGKPFSLIELQARVKALLRRQPKVPTEKAQSYYVEIADLIFDLKLRSAFCKGTRIDLTPKEFALLLNFCENTNRVFSKFQLLDLIWETNLDVQSNVLEVNIMNIRRKLEKCDSKLKIQSRRNVGYWLET